MYGSSDVRVDQYIKCSVVMRGIIFVILVSISFHGFAGTGRMFPADENDPPIGKRSWLVRPCYNRQSEKNFLEVGIGRMNSINSNGGAGLNTFTLGSVGFTLGADMCFGDTSLIIAPKMGIEGCLTIFGGRLSYGYYMQDNNTTGVIGIEGGLCILSVFYAYAGYNFVKGDKEAAVIDEGVKFSVGLNIPFGPREIPGAKRPSH